MDKIFKTEAVETDCGFYWDTVCWLDAGDEVNGFYVNESGWALIESSIGKASDGGMCACCAPAQYVQCYGVRNPEHIKIMLTSVGLTEEDSFWHLAMLGVNPYDCPVWVWEKSSWDWTDEEVELENELDEDEQMIYQASRFVNV